MVVYFAPKLGLNLHFNIFVADSTSASINETTSNTKLSQLIAISQSDSLSSKEIIPDIVGLTVFENPLYLNVFIRKVYQRFTVEVKQKPHGLKFLTQKFVRPTITIILSQNIMCDSNSIENLLKKVGHPSSRIFQFPKLEPTPTETIWEIISYQNFFIVLFDYMGFPIAEQAKNLKAFNLQGKEIWTASHPTSKPNDCYTQISVNGKKLIAYNFAGYKCDLDPNTGKINQAIFTK